MKNRSFLFTLSFFFLFLLQGTAPPATENNSGQRYFPAQNPKISQRLANQLCSFLPSGEALKIWIFFQDKGLTSLASLKNSLSETRQTLNERCLWRRLKVLEEANLVDYADLPLFKPYTNKVQSMVRKVRTVSRWLNALSAEASPHQIEEVAKLAFVREVDLVISFKREEVLPSPLKDSVQEESHPSFLDYGPSFGQLNQINVLPLHALGYSGRNVLVCMMDVGFRKSHEIFWNAHIVAEWDFVNGDGDVQQDPLDPQDYPDEHGTGTWSVLGGFKPGKLIGPAYGASFLLAKTETTNFEKPIEEDFWVAGIEWAESLGAEVVSSSLGYTDWYTFEDMNGETALTTRAANRAASLGVVVVNAAGNERNNPWRHT